MSRKPRPLVLSESECQQLAHIAERGDDWRARQRSRTLLMLHSGKPINAVAAEQGLERDTVAAHQRRCARLHRALLTLAPLARASDA